MRKSKADRDHRSPVGVLHMYMLCNAAWQRIALIARMARVVAPSGFAAAWTAACPALAARSPSAVDLARRTVGVIAYVSYPVNQPVLYRSTHSPHRPCPHRLHMYDTPLHHMHGWRLHLVYTSGRRVAGISCMPLQSTDRISLRSGRHTRGGCRVFRIPEQ